MNFDAQNPQPGRYRDVPIDTYHRAPGISRSGLMRLHNGTPRDLQHYLMHGIPETDAMRLGSAVDMMVFEPERVDREIAVMPKFGRSKAALVEKEAWELENNEKLVLKQPQYDEAVRLATATRNAKCVRGLMGGAMAQESFWWREGGTLCKTRPDGYDPETGETFDLKTARSIDDRHIATAAVDFGYDLQASMNCAAIRSLGLKWTAHVLVFVSKAEPTDVRALTIAAGSNWHLLGDAKLMRLTAQYQQCVDKDEWPGYDGSIQPMPMPKWVENKLNDELELERAANREGNAA